MASPPLYTPRFKQVWDGDGTTCRDIQPSIQHGNIRVLVCRPPCCSLLLFKSLFDDARVASHDEPLHEPGHSPCVTLRTQDN